MTPLHLGERVLAALRLGPFTVAELAKMLCSNETTIRAVVDRLNRKGLVRALAHRRQDRKGGTPSRVWMLTRSRSTYRESLPIDSAGAMHVAIAIARRFRSKGPSVPLLRESFGMSRAVAYRWCRAWKDAGGVQA